MSLERDPEDGQVMFIEVPHDGFEPRTLEDYHKLMMGLSRIALEFYDRENYIGYPIFRFGQ